MDSFAIDPGIVEPLPELAVAWRPPDQVDIEQRAAANHRRTLLQGANSVLVFSTVTYPLRHICPNPDIRDALEERAVALQQIRVKAMMAMNFHCCRLFEHHRRSHPNYPVVPARSRTMETALQLDEATFYRCCTAVFGDEQRPAPRVSTNAALEESINKYKASRSRVMSYIPPTLFDSSSAIKELANGV